MRPDKGKPEQDKNVIDPETFTFSPAEAIQIIKDAPEQTLILDLDLTLVLGPTTEAFLDLARPFRVTSTVLAALDKVSPWRLLPGGQDNRDWVRVVTVLLLIPSSYPQWRSTANAWTVSQTNHPLVDAARNHRGRVIVVTRGFSAIVKPVIKALRLRGDDEVLTIACKAWRWRGERQLTKTEQVARSPRLETAADAIVVSDSIHDYDLFVACQKPVLTEWEGAHWITPHKNTHRLLSKKRTKPLFNSPLQRQR